MVRPGGADRYDTVLLHDEVPSLSLELHYGLEGTSQRVTALDPGALWERRQPIACAGTPAFGLPLTDELVVLAAHAGKPHHGFVRLAWIADLAMIVGDAAERGTPVDWERVRALAAESQCLTVVAAALALAGHAGVEAPAGLFPLPTKGWRGVAIGHLVSVTWPISHHLDLPGYHLNYALTDAPAQRLKILLVLLASGHRIGSRARHAVTWPGRALVRAARQGRADGRADSTTRVKVGLGYLRRAHPEARRHRLGPGSLFGDPADALAMDQFGPDVGGIHLG